MLASGGQQRWPGIPHGSQIFPALQNVPLYTHPPGTVGSQGWFGPPAGTHSSRNLWGTAPERHGTPSSHIGSPGEPQGRQISWLSATRPEAHAWPLAMQAG
jgi:hypothetical protein